MRLFGALLILSAAVGTGLCLSDHSRRRLRALEDFSAALALIAGELSLRNSPLPELLEKASVESTGQAKAFFTALNNTLSLLGEYPFSRLWERALNESCPVLPQKAQYELKQLGNSLGRYDLDRQLSDLASAGQRLEQMAMQAAGEYAQLRKLGPGLGAASGLLLAILLL